jgi:hypothetical protein
MTGTIEMTRLEQLVGTWNTRGRTVPSGTDPGFEIVGAGSYEWLSLTRAG